MLSARWRRCTGRVLEALAASRMAFALRRRLSPEEVVQETLTRGLESIGRFTLAGGGVVPPLARRHSAERDRHAARDDRVSVDLEAVQRQPTSDVTPSRIARREERFRSSPGFFSRAHFRSAGSHSECPASRVSRSARSPRRRVVQSMPSSSSSPRPSGA
jgi:hypothetical protein